MSLYYSEPKNKTGIQNLERIAKIHKNPELINDGDNTSPSKRIFHELPNYDKVNAGYQILEAIGMTMLLKKCRHFKEWIEKLQALPKQIR